MNQYIKDGIVNDGTELLTKEGLIFNPTPEDFYKHGWRDYIGAKPKAGPEALEENKANLLRECKEYYESQVERFFMGDDLVWMSAVDRMTLTMLIRDGYEGQKKVYVFSKEVDGRRLIQFFKQVNRYELEARNIFHKHCDTISKMKSTSEQQGYDYTEGYPDILEVSEEELWG